jgi:hypothetical protein
MLGATYIGFSASLAERPNDFKALDPRLASPLSPACDPLAGERDGVRANRASPSGGLRPPPSPASGRRGAISGADSIFSNSSGAISGRAERKGCGFLSSRLFTNSVALRPALGGRLDCPALWGDCPARPAILRSRPEAQPSSPEARPFSPSAALSPPPAPKRV